MFETMQIFTVFDPRNGERDVAFKIYSDDTKHQVNYIDMAGAMIHVTTVQDYDDAITACVAFLDIIGLMAL